MNFDKETTTKLAERLISLYAQYVEGYIDSAMIEYNQLIKTITLKDALYLIYHTPFERHAVQMYENVSRTIGENNIPLEVKEKVDKDKLFIEKMNNVLV